MKKQIRIKILNEIKKDISQDVVDVLAMPSIKSVLSSDYFKKAKSLNQFDGKTIERMHRDLISGIYRSATLRKVRIETGALAARVDSIIRKLVGGYEITEDVGSIDDQKEKKLKRDLQSLKIKKLADKQRKEQEKLKKI